MSRSQRDRDRTSDSKQTTVDWRTEDQDAYRNHRTVNVYDFLYDAYTGLGGFRGVSEVTNLNTFDGECISYLTADPSERMYNSRVATSVYINKFRPYISSQVSPIFTKKAPHTTVQVSGEEQEKHHYKEWTDNVDGSGMTKEEFNEMVLESALRDEVAYVVMDYNNDKDLIVYMQEAATVDPYSIITDKYGKLEQIGFIGKKDEDYDERYLWTNSDLKVQSSSRNTSYVAGERKWETISTTTLVTSKMPVHAVFANPRKNKREYLPWPRSYGMAELLHYKYDLDSDHRWLLRKQAHDTMVIINADVEKVKNGVDWAIKIQDPTGSGTVDIRPYSPSHEHPKSYMEHKVEITQEIKLLADENGIDMFQTTSQAESGLSKAYTFVARNDTIKKRLKVVLSLDKFYVKFYKEYEGDGNWEAQTEYAKDFHPEMPKGIEDAEQVLSIFREYQIQFGVDEALKMVAKQYFDGNKKAVEAIILQIDAKSGNID